MSEQPTGEGEKPAPFWTPEEDLPTAEVPAITEPVDAEPEPVVEPAPEADPVTPAHAAPAAESGPPPPSVTPRPATVDEHPERVVLGAFAGGLVLASILRRLGS